MGFLLELNEIVHLKRLVCAWYLIYSSSDLTGPKPCWGPCPNRVRWSRRAGQAGGQRERAEGTGQAWCSLNAKADGEGRGDVSGVWAPVTGDPLPTLPAAPLVMVQLAAAQDIVKDVSVRCGSCLLVCLGWVQGDLALRPCLAELRALTQSKVVWRRKSC